MIWLFCPDSKRLIDEILKQCWSLMLKDFKDDDQSSSGVVRFLRLVLCISRLTIFTSYLSFYLKKNFRRCNGENKKKQTWKFYLNHLLIFKIII